MKNVLGAAALLAVGALPAAGDEIVLTNGKTLTGVRREVPDLPGKVVVDVPHGRIVLEADQVASVRPGRTLLHEYEERRRRVGDSRDPQEYARLLQWCRENRLTRYLDELARRILELDPSHEEAHRELGHEKVGDRWLPYEEAQAAKGFVQVDGRWMTRSEAELLRARRQEAEDRRRRQEEERARRREEERRRREKEWEEIRREQLRQLARLDGYFYRPDWFWPAYFRPYPWSAYLRSRRYYQEGWRYTGTRVGIDLVAPLPFPIFP
jgi:hypothetical protein